MRLFTDLQFIVEVNEYVPWKLVVRLLAPTTDCVNTTSVLHIIKEVNSERKTVSSNQIFTQHISANILVYGVE